MYFVGFTNMIRDARALPVSSDGLWQLSNKLSQLSYKLSHPDPPLPVSSNGLEVVAGNVLLRALHQLLPQVELLVPGLGLGGLEAPGRRPRLRLRMLTLTSVTSRGLRLRDGEGAVCNRELSGDSLIGVWLYLIISTFERIQQALNLGDDRWPYWTKTTTQCRMIDR